jgi:hypothetical protein
MAKTRRKAESASSILRSLEDAHSKFERTFRRAIEALRNGGSRPIRSRPKTGTAGTKAAGAPSRRRGAIQTDIARVLKKRRNGLTMAGLRNALPQLAQRSLIDATVAMRRKGLINFDRSDRRRGVYTWSG